MAFTRRYLIKLAELKDQSMIHSNVQDGKLKNILWRVQETEIHPILGTKLYKKLLDDIQAYNNGSAPSTPIPADYKTLLDEYVLPCLIAYVEYRSIPRLNSKILAKGVGRNNDEYLSTADKQAEVDLQDEYKTDAIHFRNVLISYIRTNLTLFEEYLDRTNGNIFPEDREAAAEDSFMFVSGGSGSYCDRSERGYKEGDR